MDTPTAQALYEDRMTREPQTLAIEVISLRAVMDALGENLQDLRAHIITISTEAGSEAAMIRGAGGIAAIDLIDNWLLTAMGNINDVTVAAAEGGPWDIAD